MGCGAAQNTKFQNEFYREAMSFRTNKNRGLHIDDDYSSTLTRRQIQTSGGLDFGEEIIDHADESACVKPWLSNLLSPSHPIEEDLAFPKYKLQMEHVFGFRVEDTRQDLFFLSRDDLLYISSSLAIIQNIDDYSQIIFGGFSNKEERECHDNHIMTIAFLKGNVSLVATGQRGIKPKILVWSPIDPSIIFAKFQQPKGSKEVSGLDFDKDGHYIVSFGKDDNNSFYVFDLRSKDIYWEESTGKSDFLLDVKCSSTEDEFCIVGVNKILFGYTSNKSHKNVYQKSNQKIMFTAVSYLYDGTCLIGNDRGEIRIFKNSKKIHSKNFSNGSIQNITSSKQFHKIYVTTSENLVYIFKDKGEYEKLDKFEMNSIVKALDVNEDEDIVMGLKNGDIIIKHYRDPNKSEELFLKTHSTGEVGGIVLLENDSRAISSGYDNQILVWNLRSKKCESYALINEVRPIYESDSNRKYIFPPSNRSSCISYNKSKGHIAIGIDDGTVSIRKSVKYLNNRLIPDFSIGTKKVVELKYTNYGDLLLGSCLSGEMSMFDCNDNYKKIKEIKLDFAIMRFDWDTSNNFIQGETSDSNYIFFNTQKFQLVKDPLTVKDIEWNDITCKFCYNVQGVFMGSTDPDFISCVSKAHSRKLLISGNDTFMTNLFNYPVIDDNSKFKGYKGHSGKVNRVVWTLNDEKILSIAKDDKAIILWNVVREEK